MNRKFEGFFAKSLFAERGAGHEGSPPVFGDTMHVHTPFPNTVYAVNLKDQSFKWKYEPKQDVSVIPLMFRDTGSRGLRGWTRPVAKLAQPRLLRI